MVEATADDWRAIAEKLEIINLQLAQRKETRRKIARGLLIALCIVIAVIFLALYFSGSTYLAWDYSDPETAVVGVAFHALEWLFARVAPIIFIIAVIGIVLTRKKP